VERRQRGRGPVRSVLIFVGRGRARRTSRRCTHIHARTYRPLSYAHLSLAWRRGVVPVGVTPLKTCRLSFPLPFCRKSKTIRTSKGSELCTDVLKLSEPDKFTHASGNFKPIGYLCCRKSNHIASFCLHRYVQKNASAARNERHAAAINPTQVFLAR